MTRTVLALYGAAASGFDDASSAAKGIVTVTIILFILMMIGLWFGWRARRRRQSDVAVPDSVPAPVLDAEPTFRVEGTYITTVSGDDWLERIAVHGLGMRADALFEVHPQGVAMLLAGAPNFFISTDNLISVTTASGMAGKFVEKDGLIAIKWRLGDQEVTSGFRTATQVEQDATLQAIDTITSATARNGSENNA